MILLNDILKLPNLKDVRIRFNLNFGDKRPAIDYFTDQTLTSRKKMLDGQYWNYGKKGNFSVGNISLGFVPIPRKNDCWLLFHIGKVQEYDKYLGRIIVRFKNRSQNLIRKGDTTLPLCEIEEILPNVYNNDFFPGYANVNVSWKSLQILINKSSWRTALGNQKGVYLLVDSKTGKKYVGAAYGDDMLLGRWEEYIKTYHGGNKRMKSLKNEYIRDNFYFTILEHYNPKTDDQIILDRESYWKQVLMTRQFGYNDN